MLKLEVPEGIEKQIADALLSSVVGDAIKDGVGRLSKKIMEEDWDSPVRRAIQNIGTEIVKEMLDTPENREIVRQHVLAAFQDKTLIKSLIIEAFNRD
jgi:hypothetical protein